MKKIKYFLLLAVIFLFTGIFFVSVAFAHSGRTNSAGCHNDNIHGGYHCHNGGYSSYSAPSIKTYWWGIQSFTDYNTYYKTRWNGIQDLYREYLGRGFYSQDEGIIYTDSDKSKAEIELELISSDEHKSYLQKTSKMATATPIRYAVDPEKESDYSWIWWILIIGGIIFWIARSNRK